LSPRKRCNPYKHFAILILLSVSKLVAKLVNTRSKHLARPKTSVSGQHETHELSRALPIPKVAGIAKDFGQADLWMANLDSHHCDDHSAKDRLALAYDKG